MKIKHVSFLKTLFISAGIAGLVIFGFEFFLILFRKKTLDYYYMILGLVFTLIFIIGLVLKYIIKNSNKTMRK